MISDAALPWALLGGCLAAGLIGGPIAVLADRKMRAAAEWVAAKLSRLPALEVDRDCGDCQARVGEPHRKPSCPGNLRQLRIKGNV